MTLRRVHAYLFDNRMLFNAKGASYQDNNQTSRNDEMAVSLLGTDDLGRDVFSRLLYGMRMSFLIGACGMCVSVLFGVTIGFLSGYLGNSHVDQLLMRFTDLFLAVPSLFLVIAVVAFIGSSTLMLILILGLTSWMGVARLVRGEVITLREKEF